MILLLWPEEQLPVIMRTPPNSNVTSTTKRCVVSFCCTTSLLLSLSVEQQVEQCLMSLHTSLVKQLLARITQLRNAVDCMLSIQSSVKKILQNKKQLRSRAERARTFSRYPDRSCSQNRSCSQQWMEEMERRQQHH